MENSAAKSISITLLHGTKWRKAIPEWVQPGSVLYQALEEAFGDRAELSFLPWSGANRHGPRLAAAKALQAKIANDTKEMPNAAHYVIAHSHGGNVAFMACADAQTHAALSGICCMGTPFLKFRRNFTADTVLSLGAFVLLLAVIFYGANIVTTMRDGLREFAGLALLLIPGLAGGWLINRMSTYAKRPDLDFADIDPAKVLIIRSLADEASGVLQAASFVQWIQLRIVSRVLQWQKDWFRFFYSTWRGRALLVVFLGIPAIIAVGKDYGPAFFSSHILAWINAILPIILVFPFILLMAVAAVAVVIRSVVLLAFGWDMPLRAFRYRISAEAAPLGDWRVVTIEPGVTLGADGTTKIKGAKGSYVEPMMHNEAYAHPDGVKAIVSWIKRLASE